MNHHYYMTKLAHLLESIEICNFE